MRHRSSRSSLTACPNLTILVTSRVRLRLSNEREVALAPLSLANVADPLERLQTNEANALFADRARRVDPHFTLSDQNAVAVTEICQRLDGLPLAIELAASRLRILPVPSLLERLDHRLPLLTGGDRDRPAHQQSMRATIAWSYDLLGPDEQRFLQVDVGFRRRAFARIGGGAGTGDWFEPDRIPGDIDHAHGKRARATSPNLEWEPSLSHVRDDSRVRAGAARSGG